MTIRFTYRQKIDALLYRNEVVCAICKGRVLPGDAVDWDHVHPVCLGGDHHYTNCRPLHKECHKSKTRRDVKDNAKCDRLTGKTGNRKWKRTLKSPGFRKDIRRKMNGEVEKRT